MRCLIADDHPLMRAALRTTIVAHWPDAEVAEAASFPGAWSLAPRFPDLCLIDLAMPGATPCEGVARLRAVAPQARILVITGLEEAGLAETVLVMGASAVIGKTLEPDAMVAAIRSAIAGIVPPTRSAELVGRTALTPRQEAVLGLVARGLTNKQIAARLGISPATVKIHMGGLLANLGAANRTEAVARARVQGLL